MSYLLLILLVPRERLATTDDGRYLLQRFLHYFPKHIPEKCGDVEPLKHVFDEGDLNRRNLFHGTRKRGFRKPMGNYDDANAKESARFDDKP